MSYIKPDTPYPVYAQPSMTGNAIIETQHNEKASLAMTTTSLLTAMSIACLDWPPESPDNQYHLNK